MADSDISAEKLREKYQELLSMSDDELTIHNSNQRSNFGAYPVYIFRPELRKQFHNRTLTKAGYHEVSVDALFARASRHIDRIARIYGFRGKILSRKTRTVGVQGDHRTYAYVAEIICGSNPNYQKLSDASTAITNEVTGINRVVIKLG